MRTILITLMLICTVFIFGQTKHKDKNVEIAEKLQSIETKSQEQYILFNKKDQSLQNQLEKIEKEVQIYREDVRENISIMHTDMGLWFAAITLVMAILGIVVPLFLNKHYDKTQKENLNEIKLQLEAAKKSLTDMEKLKEDVNVLKQKTEESEVRAKQSANESMVNKLFAEAIAESKKNPLKAIELYTEILSLDISNAGAYNNRGGLRMDLKYFEGAMSDFNKSIELESNIAGTYDNRGMLKIHMKDYNGALADFEKAIELNPSFANAYNNIAETFKNLGQLENALKEINIAISLDERYTVSYVTRGEIYMEMKRYDDAIKDFTTALSLDNHIREAYKYRAECYRKYAEETVEEKDIYISLAESDEKYLVILTSAKY